MLSSCKKAQGERFVWLICKRYSKYVLFSAIREIKVGV